MQVPWECLFGSTFVGPDIGLDRSEGPCLGAAEVSLILESLGFDGTYESGRFNKSLGHHFTSCGL